MTKVDYRNDSQAIAGLVRDGRVHRDVYLDPTLFELEMERVFARGWQYVGHESQVPNAGDYITTTLAGTPVILVRDADKSVRVVINRCAHKGAQLVFEDQGNAGRMLRCPYHAWSYKFDGSLLAVSLKAGYENTGFWESEAAGGLPLPGATASYRGFVFARLAKEGPSFTDYFGEVLSALDNMADRSPTGQLQIGKSCIRSVIRCNWKMYLENINDTVHPISTHESAAVTARKVGEHFVETDPTALEQLLPFGSGYDFYTKMGARTLPNGHSILGTKFSIHSEYADVPGYRDQLVAAHGEARADEVLAYAPQNVVFYPGLATKGSPQVIRVLRPLAANLTQLEVWAFQPVGAPDTMLKRGETYSRLVFSPMSVVAHDDVHLFESQQKALASAGNPWVNLQRQYRADETVQPDQQFEDGNNELVMRNQYKAWHDMMMSPATGE
ncbi:MAG: Rieske 2Fe-2S domain-containing protein [Alcaligenaceae bacterium]|nr:Rieske 2Fe-2S domain-containing protein [Alcaligenaceae bacterium]